MGLTFLWWNRLGRDCGGSWGWVPMLSKTCCPVPVCTMGNPTEASPIYPVGQRIGALDPDTQMDLQKDAVDLGNQWTGR
jgi:hypothetical protein